MFEALALSLVLAASSHHTALTLAPSTASAHTSVFAEGAAQLDDNTKPFFEADPTSGALTGALLLCRVDVVGDKGWDTFGAVDLRVTFTAGARAPVSVWGPEDRANAVLGVPAFDVKPGEKISFVVEDRDVTENELIARGAVAFQGKTPFRVDLQDTQIECRALPHELVVVRAKALLASAARAVAEVEAVAPKLEEQGLGFPWLEHARAGDDVRKAAAWVGAGDADVAAAAAGVERARAAFDDAARAAVKRAAQALPEAGASFALPRLGLKARVLKGPAVTLEVTADGDVTCSDHDIAASFTFLTARGAVERLAMADGYEPKKLLAGEKRVVRIRADGAAPELLRVNETGALLRVR